MAPYLEVEAGDDASEPCIYDLCAITVHKGTAMGGHYLAFGRGDVGVVSGSPNPATILPEVVSSGRQAAGPAQPPLSDWISFNDANIRTLSTEDADRLFGSKPTVSEGPVAPHADEVALEAKDETVVPPESATETSNTEAPPPPKAKPSSDNFLGSTYDVQKDAYLLLYRRRSNDNNCQAEATEATDASVQRGS